MGEGDTLTCQIPRQSNFTLVGNSKTAKENEKKKMRTKKRTKEKNRERKKKKERKDR